MGVLTSWSRARKTVASALVLAVAAGVPVTFAILNQGFPITDVSLTSKDVWVTNGSSSIAGRLNRQIDELTAGVKTLTTSFDVVQDGPQVFLHDLQLNTLERIEQSRVTLTEKAVLPTDATVSLGKNTIAITDPASGKVWVVDVSNDLSFDAATAKPTVVLGAGGKAVVGHDGTVYATSPKKSQLFTIEGAGASPSSKKLEIPSAYQLSVVGTTPVILDTAKNVLITGDNRRVDLKTTAFQLQQPGAANSFALVSSEDSLLKVPLGGGDVTRIQANIPAQASASVVSAPVWLNGCAYGAWSAAQRYLQACDGAKTQLITIEQPTDGAQLEFRVNRNVIALNNLLNGNTWVLNSALRLVDNWDEITPPEESKEVKGHEKSSLESFEDTLAQRTDTNHPPIARPDNYGVRTGRTTILPVLNNDTDQDGDVLVISNYSEVEQFGRLDLIDGGRALQFTPKPTATGGASFRYSVSDGRTGGIDETSVNLQIVPDGENKAPVSIRDGQASVEAGQKVSYNVLTDWIDPDGDEIFLKAAAPTSADTVRFSPDGFITFEDKSGTLGKKVVSFVVTDGTATATGKLTIDVKASGSLNPIGTPDFTKVFTGETVVVEPLKNDLTPSGSTLKLVGVDDVPSTATVTPNLQTGTVSVSSSTVGSIYLKYSLSAGKQSSVGLIRVDVVANPDKPLPPIAVKDIAYLRPKEPTTVKLLTNDVSPTGKILAVQSIDTTSLAPGVKVELLNSTVVRITGAALTKQTQFTYTISDGEQTAVAGVTVVPVAAVVNRQPPVAMDDNRVVRAGDIASVAVLKNDYHPDQQAFTLDPELADTSNEGDGLAFVNGDTVRYQAPTKPGEYSVLYRIRDQFDETATAKVTFTVTAIDRAHNQPPVPTKQVARVFAGATVTIAVPLDAIDPDGDSVVLNGIQNTPLKGTIVKQTPTSFVYKAFGTSEGTDTFTYKVVDALGGVGVGEISVGVIPRSDTQAQPNAVDDNIEVKPGKTASVQVALNDSDPNGYPISVSKKLLNVDKELDAQVKGAKIIITAPTVEGGYSLRYSITNGQGGTDSAFVHVRVTKNAAVVYPTATDYYVLDSQVKGTKAISVNVQSLINNPSGLDSDLLITTEGPNATRASVNQTTGRISVVPGKERYAVAYRVTDPTNKKLTATAFIVVPPAVTAGSAPAPYLRTDLPEQIVKMNGTKTWDLSKILVVPSGKPAIITNKSTVKALFSNGKSSYVDNNTLTFTPQKDYRGTAAIVFEVTDGTSADDPNGRKATITLPITVGDPSNDDVAPKFTKLALNIEAGEAETRVDLRDSTSHPNRALIPQFTYTNLRGATNDIQAHLDGNTLVTSSKLGVQPGASATLTFDIKFKEFTVPGTVVVTDVASTRPTAEPVEDDIKAVRAQTTSTNVLDNDFNPFSQDNKPLTLIKASISNDAATGATLDFKPNGVVTVTPGPAFIGTIAISYTVQDATKDPSRNRDGLLNVVVRDKPDAPNAPAIVSENDKSVTISWQAPATNGEPILDYTIRTSGGVAAKTVSADTASTTIDGLTNGQSYTFTITARNLLGDSTASPTSAAARPFGAPGAPGSASVASDASGSGTVTATWSAADGNGRDIDHYVVTFTPGGAKTVSGTTTSATLAGSVGTSYSASVVAYGPTGLASSAQASSGSTTPQTGQPSSATVTTHAAGDHTATVSWGAGRSTGTLTYEWQVNSGPWHNVGSAKSATYTGSASETVNLNVRAYTSGYATPSAITSASGTIPADPAPPTPTITIIAKDATTHTCSDGSTPCNSAVIQATNLGEGDYTVNLQYDQGGVWKNAGSTVTRHITANGQARSQSYLGVKPYNGVRVQITGGPSGTVTSPELSAAQWNALPHQ